MCVAGDFEARMALLDRYEALTSMQRYNPLISPEDALKLSIKPQYYPPDPMIAPIAEGMLGDVSFMYQLAEETMSLQESNWLFYRQVPGFK